MGGKPKAIDVCNNNAFFRLLVCFSIIDIIFNENSALGNHKERHSVHNDKQRKSNENCRVRQQANELRVNLMPKSLDS